MNQIFLNGITAVQFVELLTPLVRDLIIELQVADVLLTREETCTLLSCNKTSLWKHTKSGKLKSYGMGNRVYYKRHEVLASIKPLNH